ncbi:uncharacterized protein LOC129718694 isoform X2 [Wyeomyia smithii]|uniref:uncharacterized protein LOC129718694 isoform X2 n=1 Tax=Wyeomyia smithii TaxID=174621 RepID=UPI002467E19A|nr:uncharacterized protein LOC129718694 isoform X2 [Wyeomyia smithii]
MPQEPEQRKIWLRRAGLYAENPMPENLAKQRLHVCQNHFDLIDFKIVTVKAGNYSQRYILGKDILPHKHLPYYSGCENYFFNTGGEEKSTEGEVKITQDIPDEDIPIEDILAVNYDVGVTENGNLRDKATLTDIVGTVPVAVQCRAIMVSKEVQTSRALNFHQKLMTSPRQTSVSPRKSYFISSG